MPSKAVLVGTPESDSIDDVLHELGAAVVAWKSAGIAKRKALRERLDALLDQWAARHKRIEARIQAIFEGLRAQGITPDPTHLNKLAAAEADAQRRVTRHMSEVALQKKLLAHRLGLLKTYRSAQERLTFDRNAFGRRVGQQFRDAGVEFTVGVKFRSGQLVGDYEGWLRESIGNRFIHGDRVTQFCQLIHPADLAAHLRSGRNAGLAALRDSRGTPFLTPEEAKNFVAHVGADQSRVLALDLMLRDDRPEISLTQRQDAKTKTYPFAHLSFGQRASIMLGILLFSDDVHPLVIDQPEDHLDSAFIYEAVVQTLRRVKERRQVIVATHNANIAVLGDAELIVPLRSWAGQGRVTERGSVDTAATRKRACAILEGGADAYRRRGEMYGLSR